MVEHRELGRRKRGVLLRRMGRRDAHRVATTPFSWTCSSPSKDALIVALSANAVTADRKERLRFGMDRFVTKPVGAADLSAALSDASRVRAGRVQPRTAAPAADPAAWIDRARIGTLAADGGAGFAANLIGGYARTGDAGTRRGLRGRRPRARKRVARWVSAKPQRRPSASPKKLGDAIASSATRCSKRARAFARLAPRTGRWDCASRWSSRSTSSWPISSCRKKKAWRRAEIRATALLSCRSSPSRVAFGYSGHVGAAWCHRRDLETVLAERARAGRAQARRCRGPFARFLNQQPRKRGLRFSRKAARPSL